MKKNYDGKIPDLVDMPNLLEIQRNSYDLFLQKDIKHDELISNFIGFDKVIEKYL